MQKFLQKIGSLFTGGNRFDRYYSGLVGDGSGYPTADEARRDLRKFDETREAVQWQR